MAWISRFRRSDGLRVVNLKMIIIAALVVLSSLAVFMLAYIKYFGETYRNNFPQDDFGKRESYVNERYGFSFEYPSYWGINHDKKSESHPARGMIFSVEVTDPERDLERFIGFCINNRNTGWGNSEPTEVECAPLLQGIKSSENEKYLRHTGRPMPRNLFVRVYESELQLRDWLIATYKGHQGDELSDYEVGSDIELAGVRGYHSSTGCCAGSDEAYVIKSGMYIYEFGTNSTEDPLGLIERYKNGFRIMPPTMQPSLGQASEVQLDEVKKITEYCKTIDLSHSPEIFVRNNAESAWRHTSIWPEKIEDRLFGAEVWVQDGKIFFVGTQATSLSGDWMQYVDYCFRKDGTIAKVSETLNTFYTDEDGGVRVFRDYYFDMSGGLVSSSTQVLNMHTGITSTSSFQDRDTPIYIETKQLPFFNLIGGLGLDSDQ